MNLISKKICILLTASLMSMTGYAGHTHKNHHPKKNSEKHKRASLIELERKLEKLLHEKNDAEAKKVLTSLKKIATEVKKSPDPQTQAAARNAFKLIGRAIEHKTQNSNNSCCCDNEPIHSNYPPCHKCVAPKPPSCPPKKKVRRISCCQLLYNIRRNLKKCCRRLHRDIENVEKYLKNNFACQKTIIIKSVPATLTTSGGHYCVSKDLTYTGSESAITVAAPGIKINFNSHALTLTDPAATGLLIDRVYDIEARNGVIQYESQSTNPAAAGVSITNSDSVLLNSMSVVNAYYGVYAASTAQIALTQCQINEAYAAHFEGSTVLNVAMSNSSFTNATVMPIIAGLDITDGSNITVAESIFTNSDIYLRSVNTASIASVQSVITDQSYIYSSLQLGASDGYIANNVSVVNSAFYNETANSKAHGIILANGNGMVLQNLIVTANPSNGAKCQIGVDVASTSVSNASISNCVFSSSTTTLNGIEFAGYVSTPNTGVIVKECIVDNCSETGILVQNTTGSTVEGNKIHRCRTGIKLGSQASSNIISTNETVNNIETGILLNKGTGNNVVIANQSYYNDVGIDNAEGLQSLYNNYACNNTTFDCENVPNHTGPGVGPTTGINLCCTSNPS